ncbi:class F sortase [Streptomyces sp. NPDC020490]|uniref:class F sortase n=1 Tax=Streptomyces sp. NPDC020490 TaxID=3365078 RepID=UPI0037894080
MRRFGASGIGASRFGVRAADATETGAPGAAAPAFRRGGGRRRFGNAVIAAVTAAALCSGAWLLRNGTEAHPPPQPSAAQAHSARDGDRPGAPALPPSPPERIRIPAIRVDAPLMGLGLTPAGSLDVPPAAERNLAGWYRAGTAPGETGTAIVAGHVDNADGPAVFYRLGALKKGAAVDVDRRDGSVAVFTVDAVEVYDAGHFPDEKVYGAAKRPELRVITCGGGYSRATGYRGNVVVFAHLTGSR